MTARDEIVRFIYEVSGDKDLAATAATMLKAGDAAETTSAEFDKFSKALKDAATQAGQIQKAIAQKAGLADLKQQLADATATAEKFRTEIAQTENPTKKLQRSATDADKAVASLNAQINAESVALQKSTGALQKAGIDTSNLAGAFSKVKADGNAAAQALAQLGQQGTAAAKGTQDAAKGVKDVGDRSKESAGFIDQLKANLGTIVGAAAAAAAALKTLQFGKDSFADASAIEDTLARVKATAKDAAAEFDKLGDQIEKSAVAANVSSQQSAAAALALAQQGQTAAEIFQTLTPTLLLAKDAGIEVGQAAAVVDDTLDLFSKDASEAADVVDKLVAASKGSKEGLGGMADAIRALAPDARALGIDFEHLVGLLGLLGQNGIDAGKATRGLRTIFQDLQDPTSKFSQALGELGDHSSDLGKAIATLQTSGKRGQEALQTLDGAARSLILFLVQQAPGALQGFTESLQKAGGTASETARQIDETLGGSWRSFTNAIDRLGSALAKTSLEPLREEFTKLATRLTEFANSEDFAKLSDSFKTLFTNAAQAFETFLSTADFSKFSTTATNAINDVAASLKDLKTTSEQVAASVNVFGDFLSNLHNIDQEGGKALNGLINSIGSLGQASLKLTEGDIPGMVDAVNHAKSAFGQASDSYDKFSTALNGSSSIFANVTASAQTTAPAVEAMSTAVAASADEIAKLGEIGPGVFENTAAAANEAAAATKSHADELIKARQAVADTRAELDKLVTSGDASAEAMQKAAKAYADAQRKLDDLTNTTTEAADAQRALKQAFETLGIVTQEKLKKAAEDAKGALDTIRQAFLAGNATLEDTRRAYDAYAAKVRASTADSTAAVKAQSEATLAATAAALGFTDAAAKAGAAGAQAGSDTATGFDQAKDSIQGASDAASNLATNATAAAAGVQDLGTGAASAATATANLGTATQGIVLLSADQLRLLKEIGSEFLSGAISGEEYARRVLVAMGGVDEELIRQQQNLRSFQNELDQLNSEIAGETGDGKTQEDIRHAQNLRDLKDEFQVQGTLTSAQYQQLLKAENDLHDLKLKNLKQEQQAAAGTSAQGGGVGAPRAPNAPTEPTPAPAPAPRGGVSLTITNPTFLSSNKKAFDDFMRRVRDGLNDLAIRS